MAINKKRKPLKWENSKRLFEESLKVLPSGVSSNARLWKLNCPIYMPCEIFVKKAFGSHLWDVDGNQFIDYRLGYGPVILGHSYKKIHDAVHEADQKGLVYALGNELEIKVAKMIADFVPTAEMVRFANSGTEATMAAIRVARAYTKKDKIIKFGGHYHGWHDAVAFSTKQGPQCEERLIPATLGLPRDYKGTLVTSWNNFESIEKLIKENKDYVAAIITEPIMGNASAIMPKDGYLKHLQELCEKYGALFILDEVKTGFRVAPGGAQELFKVKPHLSTFAKSIGNGYPIAVFSGPKDIMEIIGPGKVMHGGTYAANPVSLTAAQATLTELKKKQVWNHLFSFGTKMMRGIAEQLSDNRINYVMNGCETMFQFLFMKKKLERINCYGDLQHADAVKYAKFQYELLKNGVMVDEDHEEAIYISYSHTFKDLNETLEAFGNSLKVIK